MLWLGKRASELQERRKNQNKCERCGQFYPKTENQCPHCSELTDQQVQNALSKRASFRFSLGKIMFIAAAIIIVLMLFI